jgi:regulator of protease activity HflC (stomatin/prohibitin superfamily)
MSGMFFWVVIGFIIALVIWKGVKIDQINRANGQAEAILAVAKATAQGISLVAESIRQEGGSDAVSLRVAEQYVGAFAKLAKESTTILLPANAGDAGSMVAQALSVFNTIKQKADTGQDKPWEEK